MADVQRNPAWVTTLDKAGYKIKHDFKASPGWMFRKCNKLKLDTVRTKDFPGRQDQ